MRQLSRTIALLLCVVLLAGTASLPAQGAMLPQRAMTQSASSQTCGDSLTWELKNGTLSISGTGKMYDYSQDFPAPWRNQADSVTKAVVNSGVTSVGSYAFSGCKNLTAVTLPESLRTVGKMAFLDCARLKTLTLPEDVTQIGEYAFGYYQGTGGVLPLTGLSLSGGAAAERYAKANSHITYLSHEPDVPENPTVLSAVSNVASGVRIQWSAVSGVGKYRVFYRQGSGSWKKAGDTAALNYTVTGLTSGVSYTFAVSSLSPQGAVLTQPEEERGRSVVYVAPPVIKSMYAVNGGVSVSWGKVKGAARYRVFYRASGSIAWSRGGDTTATTLQVLRLKAGVTYHFTVRCISSDGRAYTSYYDTRGKSMTLLATPVITKTENLNGGVRVTWNRVSGAAKYRLFYRTPGNVWKQAGDTTGTSLTVGKLTSNQNYIFTVRCVSADGRQYTSYYNPNGVTRRYLSAPVVKSAVCVNDGITVTWQRVTGIAKYRVFYRTSGGSWHYGGDSTGSSMTITDLVGGKNYTFTVRGINSAATAYVSSYNSTGVSCTYIEPPELDEVEYDDDSITIRWYASVGAAKYRVFYKSSSGWVRVGDTTATRLRTTSLPRSQRYIFTVRCISSDGSRYTSGYDAEGIWVQAVPGQVATYNFTSAYTGSTYYDQLMSLRLSGSPRDNLVAVAMSQLGYREGSYVSSTDGYGSGYDMDNYTEFGRWYYNHVDGGDYFYKAPWCSMFVSWCANEANISSGTIPRRALVAYMKDSFDNMGRYYTWNETACGYGSKKIQKGDLIIYSASFGGRLSHIGIVTDVTYNYNGNSNRCVISTVEGNFNDRVSTRRFIMTKGSGGYIDGSHVIRGFCVPNF